MIRSRTRIAKGLVAFVALTVGTVVSQPAPVSALTPPTKIWERTDVGSIVESSPLVAQLSGQPTVMVGSRDSQLWGFNANNGGNGQGWPRNLGTPMDASPAVADVDHDGKQDVFIGTGTGAERKGDFYRLGEAGQHGWRYHPRDNDFPNLAMFSSPAIGDVNGDSLADVSGFSLGLLGWSFSKDGGVNGGWPFYQDDTIFSSPALHDVDGDGKLDYIVGSDSSWGAPVDWQGGILRAIRGDGSLIWELRRNEILRSSPVVGDVDNDGQPEIVIGAGYYYWATNGSRPSDASKVIVVNMAGQIEREFDLGASTDASPALADLNGDGVRDIVATTWYGPNDQKIYAFNGVTGAALSGWDNKSLRFGSALGQVVTADFDGDGGQDPLVGSGGGMIAYSGKTGAELFALNEGQGISYQNSAWIGDIDGNSKIDIIAAGSKAPNYSSAVVQRWEMPTTTAQMGNFGWSQFRGDNRHTGSTYGPPMDSNLCNGASASDGYIMVGADGSAYTFCSGFHGSMAGASLAKPIVGTTRKSDGSGYWMVAKDGGVFSFGSSGFHGSMGGQPLNKPIVGMAVTKTGNGYWLVASDGGIFAFGDAGFYGSMGGSPLNKPIVGMATNPVGNGYWLVASDGGIFAFGDAGFYGSMGGSPLNGEVVGMTSTDSSNGYWMVAKDGGIFAFGDAGFYGSMGGTRLNREVVSMSSAAGGYRLVAKDGGIFSFGAPFFGSTGGIRNAADVVAMG